MESVIEKICEYKVVVCAGTGGVGKTSISAALGVAAASSGKKVLVLTIDPAKRLKTALGLSGLGEKDIVKFDLAPEAKGELYAAVVDAKKVFDDFVIRVSPDEESSSMLLNNLLYKKLSLGLQGSQEFTSLERFFSLYETGEYDLVILDTPPSQHAVDFLEAPQRMNRIFDESILKWFVSERESRFKFVNKVIRKGTKTVFGVLEKLTGKQFVDEIFNFFVCMKFIRKSLVERNMQIDELLHSKELGFLLVTAYDAKKIDQAMDFSNRLREKGFNFAGMIMNRSFPEYCEKDGLGASSPSLNYYNKMKAYYDREKKAYENIKESLGKEIINLKVDEVFDETEPVKMIKKMSEHLKWSKDD